MDQATLTPKFRTIGDWIYDARNNRANVKLHGSEAAAIAALRSCSDCSGCSDCSDCSRCSRCSGCSGCSPQSAVIDVPIIADIHRAVYAAVTGSQNSLDMSKWHSCETTHCRAGWVVHLAGEAGYSLEKQTSPLFAAQQIYKKSGYEISPCRFYDSNEAAMADMKRLAEEAAAK